MELTNANWARFHYICMGVWLLLAIPTLVLWKSSVLWIAIMSLYANFAGHWGAAEAAKDGSESGKAGHPDMAGDVVEEIRVKWAKLLVTTHLDIQTRLLISLFLEDLKRLEK